MKDVIIDPTGHYAKRVPADQLQQGCIEACGFLLGFIFGKGTTAQNMAQNYKFHTGWSEPLGADVVDGLFTYPGDEPFYPIVKIINEEHPQEVVYIYSHAIVAVVENDILTMWTRMD